MNSRVKMNDNPVYERGDPCLDGYFSVKKQHLMFGARRIGPAGPILDAMACSFMPLISNEDIGCYLLQQLELTKNAISFSDKIFQEIQLGMFDRIALSESKSEANFIISYSSFTLWTKDDEHTPYFIGVPVSDRFAFGENISSVSKEISREVLGFEFQRFLMKFMG
jgi:hypothetical protein